MLPKDIPGGKADDTDPIADILGVLGKADEIQEKRRHDFRFLIRSGVFLVIAVTWHIDLMTLTEAEMQRFPVGTGWTAGMVALFYVLAVLNASKIGRKP